MLVYVCVIISLYPDIGGSTHLPTVATYQRVVGLADHNLVVYRAGVAEFRSRCQPIRFDGDSRLLVFDENKQSIVALIWQNGKLTQTVQTTLHDNAYLVTASRNRIWTLSLKSLTSINPKTYAVEKVFNRRVLLRKLGIIADDTTVVLEADESGKWLAISGGARPGYRGSAMEPIQDVWVLNAETLSVAHVFHDCAVSQWANGTLVVSDRYIKRDILSKVSDFCVVRSKQAIISNSVSKLSRFRDHAGSVYVGIDHVGGNSPSRFVKCIDWFDSIKVSNTRW